MLSCLILSICADKRPHDVTVASTSLSSVVHRYLKSASTAAQAVFFKHTANEDTLDTSSGASEQDCINRIHARRRRELKAASITPASKPRSKHSAGFTFCAGIQFQSSQQVESASAVTAPPIAKRAAIRKEGPALSKSGDFRSLSAGPSKIPRPPVHVALLPASERHQSSRPPRSSSKRGRSSGTSADKRSREARERRARHELAFQETFPRARGQPHDITAYVIPEAHKTDGTFIPYDVSAVRHFEVSRWPGLPRNFPLLRPQERDQVREWHPELFSRVVNVPEDFAKWNYRCQAYYWRTYKDHPQRPADEVVNQSNE